MHRLAPLLVLAALLAAAPARAQDPAPAPAAPPAAAARADEIHARYAQAERLIQQIQATRTEPARSAAVEELRRALTHIDDAYTVAEKANHAQRTLAAVRAAVDRQRLRLTEAGHAMALATGAEPPDPAAVQLTGNDYTIQEAILKALEEKARKEERRQTLGTAEALRLMQEVE